MAKSIVTILLLELVKKNYSVTHLHDGELMVDDEGENRTGKDEELDAKGVVVSEIEKTMRIAGMQTTQAKITTFKQERQ